MRPANIDVAEMNEAIYRTLASYPDATVAVAIRDPSRDFAFDMNGDRIFHAASTMKVPVLIELFRQASGGHFSLEDSLVLGNTFTSIVDGSEYSIADDSDDQSYQRLGKSVSITELADLMITVSSNLATNILIDLVTADSVQATGERLGATTMRVLRGVEDIKAYRQGLSNTATANDLASYLTALLEGKAVDQTRDQQMIAIMHRQQFNEMIPAGLPPETRVAHKTGNITEIHHDAAIIYPANDNPYVLVILTEGIAEEEVSAKLGAEIAGIVHARVRPSSTSENL